MKENGKKIKNAVMEFGLKMKSNLLENLTKIN